MEPDGQWVTGAYGKVSQVSGGLLKANMAGVISAGPLCQLVSLSPALRLDRFESMLSASRSTQLYCVAVPEAWPRDSVRGRHWCWNLFHLSSGRRKRPLFYKRSLPPLFPLSTFFFSFPLQPQRNGGPYWGRGHQGATSLKADLQSPDGSTAGQLHRGVHQESNGAVSRKTPNTHHNKDLLKECLWECCFLNQSFFIKKRAPMRWKTSWISALLHNISVI